jgi:DNA-binding MarR family transcriptional regulator
VTPQNIASLVAKLEARGLVTRHAHELHGHVRELRLTEAGQAAFEMADAHVTALEDDLIDDLGADDARALRSLLERLAAFPSHPATP